MKKKPAPRSPAPSTTVTALLEQLASAQGLGPDGAHADPIQGDSDVLVTQWEQQFANEDIAVLTLGIRVRRIAMLIDELIAAESERFGLKLNEMLLLMALRRVGAPYALRPTDILKLHSVTSGTVTYRIDQLTKQDLAERIPDPSDRRGYLIRLTPRGLETIDAILHRLLAAFRVSLQPMAEVPGALSVFEESLRLYERCIAA